MNPHSKMGQIRENRNRSHNWAFRIRERRLLKVPGGHVPGARRPPLHLGDDAETLGKGSAEGTQRGRVANHALQVTDTESFLCNGDFLCSIAENLVEEVCHANCAPNLTASRTTRQPPSSWFSYCPLPKWRHPAPINSVIIFDRNS